MTPDEFFTWSMVMAGHRMKALEIASRHLPKARVPELMREADKMMGWATGQAESIRAEAPARATDG